MYEKKALLEHKCQSKPAKQLPFEEKFRTAIKCISKPLILWRSEYLSYKRAAVLVGFEGRPEWSIENGLRTRKSLPYLLLEQVKGGMWDMMASPRGFEPLLPG